MPRKKRNGAPGKERSKNMLRAHEGIEMIFKVRILEIVWKLRKQLLKC
jgi:hypothetical protein